MERTLKTNWGTVSYDDSNEVKEKVFQAVLKYFTDNEAFSGEVIMQNDECIIQAPSVFSYIADDILSFQLHEVPDPQPCSDCGNPEATFDEDPYMSEINDDHTPVWMCERCRHESAMDI